MARQADEYDDLFFRETVNRYVEENDRFLRRGWLVDEVQACLAQPDCRSGNGFTIVAGGASGRVHFLRLEGVA